MGACLICREYTRSRGKKGKEGARGGPGIRFVARKHRLIPETSGEEDIEGAIVRINGATYYVGCFNFYGVCALRGGSCMDFCVFPLLFTRAS